MFVKKGKNYFKSLDFKGGASEHSPAPPKKSTLTMVPSNLTVSSKKGSSSVLPNLNDRKSSNPTD